MQKLNFSINLKVAGLDFQAQKLPLPNKASFILVTVWWPAVISGPGSILYYIFFYAKIEICLLYPILTLLL